MVVQGMKEVRCVDQHFLVWLYNCMQSRYRKVWSSFSMTVQIPLWREPRKGWVTFLSVSLKVPENNFSEGVRKGLLMLPSHYRTSFGRKGRPSLPMNFKVHVIGKRQFYLIYYSHFQFNYLYHRSFLLFDWISTRQI